MKCGVYDTSIFRAIVQFTNHLESLAQNNFIMAAGHLKNSSSSSAVLKYQTLDIISSRLVNLAGTVLQEVEAELKKRMRIRSRLACGCSNRKGFLVQRSTSTCVIKRRFEGRQATRRCSIHYFAHANDRIAVLRTIITGFSTYLGQAHGSPLARTRKYTLYTKTESTIRAQKRIMFRQRATINMQTISALS